MRLGRNFIAVLFIIKAAGGLTYASPTRPANYDDFVEPALEDYDPTTACPGVRVIQLQPLISDTDDTHIYIPSRQNAWVVNNPVVIDVDHTVYIHGGDKRITRLRSCNPSEPMFIVHKAQGVQISSMSLEPTFLEDAVKRVHQPLTSGPLADSLILVVTASPGILAPLELVDVVVDRGKVSIYGGGNHRIQNSSFNIEGIPDAAIEIGHADAQVVVVGGNFATHRYCVVESNPGPPPYPRCTVDDGCSAGQTCYPDTGAGYLERYAIWQKAGQIRAFSAGTQGGLGHADFRVDAPNTYGPHVFANIRSEGAKRLHTEGAGMVYVPTGSGDVDIVMLNNHGAWHEHFTPSYWGKGRFVEYGGSGDVWLIGNTSTRGAGHLATGEPDNLATIVALGNRFLGNDTNGDPPNDTVQLFDFGTSVPTLFDAGNLYARSNFCGSFNRCSMSNQVCDPTCHDPFGVPLSGECTTPQTEDLKCPSGQTCDVMPNGNYPSLCDCGPGSQECCSWANQSECPGLLRDFVRDVQQTIADVDVPLGYDFDIPMPLERPAVNVMLPMMVDSATCRTAVGCGAEYYPTNCQPRPPAKEYNDFCTLQATLNKALVTQSPAFIREQATPYSVHRPLLWAHSEQLTDTPGLEQLLPNRVAGGWIVGQNNDVVIETADGKFCWLSGKSCNNDNSCQSNGPCIDATTLSVFESEALHKGIVQGIRFEATPFAVGQCSASVNPCVDDLECGGTETCVLDINVAAVRLENNEALVNNTAHNFQHQFNSTFTDCSFSGGRHAFGLCINSGVMCDGNMIVNGSFEDAYIGFGVGGENAFHNTAYNATFTDNHITVGHDPFVDRQGGTWSVLHGVSIGSIEKDIEIKDGESLTLFYYNYETDSDALFDEQGSTARAFTPLFYKSRILPGSPAVLDAGSGICSSVDPVLMSNFHSNGPTFLSTHVSEGAMCNAGGLASKYALKLESVIPDWEDGTIGTEARSYEWIQDCVIQPCPPGCTDEGAPCANPIPQTGNGCTLLDGLNNAQYQQCGTGGTELGKIICACAGGSGCSGNQSIKLGCELLP